MRKYLIMALLMTLQMVARGQTIAILDSLGLPHPTTAKGVRYWFDDDSGSVTTVTDINGKHSIDVSALIDGLHTIHYQIIDSEDKVAAPYSGIFLVLSKGTNYEAGTLRYWFDDAKDVMTCNANVGVQTLDASALIDGLHTLHYQVVDTEGQASYIASNIFLKMKGADPTEKVTASKLIYWFDDQEETTTVEMTDGVQLLDAANLLDGLHTIHYMVICSDGSITSAYSSIFLRMNIDAEATITKSMRYWYDDELNATEVEIVTGTQILDASHLIDGLHTVHYQLIDDKGVVAIPMSNIFLKMTESVSTTAQSLRYWFDDESDVKVTDVAGGTQSLDVSNLLTGLHTLHYQLVDDKGKVCVPVSGLFMKMFDKNIASGENAITQYMYWMNDNSAENKKVTIENPTSPYQLITLLPMIKAPIRSSSFHFETKSGEPMIYAKNDLHVRFEDAASYWADDARSFVDYSVSEKVMVTKQLTEAFGKETFETPDSNAIKWYSMECAKGDSIAVQSSQATSIQIFAPSGDEVFITSGSESVKLGGTHAPMDGTYYIAIHDVTGSKPEMTLNYQHIDKYAILDYDVHTVGNGGCSTITFNGNGFKDLYAVDLVNGNDTIKHFDIGHEHDANTSVTFDFKGAVTGQYDAIFHFTLEDRFIKNAVKIEEAKDIELATVVSYPSTFLRGTSTTYTIKITNKGNMTAYYVPTEISLTASHFRSISSIQFKDAKGDILDAFKLSFSDTDSIDAETIDEFQKELNDITGLSSFIVLNDTINNAEVGFSDRYFTIPPYSAAIYTVEIKSSEKVALYVSIPEKWFSVNCSTNANAARKTSGDGGESGLCCEKEKWECIAGSVSDVLGLVVPPGLGCALSLSDLGVTAVFEIMCAQGNTTREKVINGLKNKQSSLIEKSFWTIIDCVTWGLSKKIDGFKSSRKQLEQQRKWELERSVENHNLYHQFIDEYDRMMYKAEDLYKQGKIAEAEKLEQEAKSLKFDASMLKVEEEKALENANKLQDQIKELNLKIDDVKNSFANIINKLKSGLKVAKEKILCTQERLDAKKNCNKPRKKNGGDSTPVNPVDPNDIYGFLANSGSKFVNDTIVTVPYRIEFENDTTFATASAHTVIVKDTLDASKFDLSSYQPTSIKIGDKDVQLSGDKEFVTTIDMRPAIYAIAQVEGMYDEKKGIATWKFTSLDPMSMEETNDVMQGFLPINYDGNGIGEVAYNINLKPGIEDGAEINNRASIVFDSNDAIMTPTWTNIIDATAPTSSITYCELKNDSTATLFIDSSDNLSGVWKYDVYIQYGEDCSWLKVVEGDTNRVINVKIYQDINHGFYVVATDSAGNVEVKTAEREFTLDLFDDSDQTDMDYELAAGWNWISHSFNTSLDPKLFSKNALRIVGQTSELYNDEQFGLIGNLNSLNSNVCYKLQMSAPVELTIDGMIYRSAQKSVELYKGWNWIGYPLSNAMTPSQALSGFEASEGDCIIGQDGMAVYSQTEGWVGTLDTFTPGKGYMYKSDSYRRMTFNSEANVSIRANNRKSANGTGWSIDFHKYPNIMALIAQLSKDGHEIEPTDYVVAAFCGDECRGVAKNVNDKLMMNIYGEGGENIIFRAMDKETGDVFDIAEIESFSSGLLGAYDSPYMLHIGGVTDIVSVDSHFGVEPIVVKDNVTVHLFGHTAQRLTVTNSNGAYVMNLHDVVDGQVLNLSELTTGIYIVSVICGENTYNQKIVKID